MNDVRVRDGAITGRHGPIPIRDYLPAREKPGAVALLWLHGGGFVSGGLDQRESHIVALRVAESGRRVRTVDYPLVPKAPALPRAILRPSENRYPVPLDAVVSAVDDLRAERPRLALGGASAGACLAASAALRLRDDGKDPSNGLVLCYGAFHAALPPLPDSVRSRVRGPRGLTQFSPRVIHRMNLNYVGSTEALTAPGVFPGGSDLAKLPATLLLDADHDTLRASGETFATELIAAGVATEHIVVPHTGHGFLNRPRTRAFRRAIGTIVEWLDRR
ncbi:alpha/beta hydrolase [Nocardia paucivorans]|uniref:alpha/beta hydrolase n=1 Tax=Nocardia paucivorans TaxID=114259 RepID=UPI0002DA6DE6|nr:alpha/beta hydrolase [Nocardia paucivorans]